MSNYRPICSLPAMYNLFSTILYGRLYPMLDQNRAEDQAGFRKTYQTTDHLATYRMMEHKMPGVGNQNVDSDGGLHEGFRLHLSQINLGGPQILQHRPRLHQPPEEDLQRPKSICTDQTKKEQHFRHPERDQSKVIRCPARCSTRYCSTH